MKIKVSNTTPLQLDWLVELAKGTHWSLNGYFIFGGSMSPEARNDRNPEWRYSTDWSQGGPIIERECIQVCPDEYSGTWVAFMSNNGEPFEFRAATPLIAALRCFVASKLGNEVEIPKELE